MTNDPESFEEGFITPAIGSRKSLPDHWDEVRGQGIAPLNVSELSDSAGMRQEFIDGLSLLGVGDGDKTVKPQQLYTADVINAAGDSVAALEPRRSAKTTSLFALALGRCANRPGYFVGYTACTTGQKARDRFIKDIAMVLQRRYEEDSRSHYIVTLDDGRTVGFRVLEGKGGERIVFDNGSIFQVNAPHGAAFRSDAYDLVILDEGGEADPEMGEDLLGAILPTFDTRPEAQLVVAGTAAKYRKGNLLWDALEEGRQGLSGIIEYAAPDSTTEEELEDWDIVRELVLLAHPGIGTLTSIETVEKRWRKLKRRQFSEEYLSIFGTDGAGAGIIDVDKFAAGALEDNPAEVEPPKDFALVMVVHPDQISAAIIAVWRVEGKARIAVLEHKERVNWLVKRTHELAVKYKRPVIHDTQGPVTAHAEELARKVPRVKLLPQTFANVKTAAALLVKEVADGMVEHYNQESLVEAVALTKKRKTGPNSWALGRVDPEDDIIDVEGAALGLRVYDDQKVAGGMGVIAA